MITSPPRSTRSLRRRIRRSALALAATSAVAIAAPAGVQAQEPAPLTPQCDHQISRMWNQLGRFVSHYQPGQGLDVHAWWIRTAAHIDERICA